jgi:hypothetical protein
MLKIKSAVIALFVICFFSACNSDFKCERHYFTKGFIGKVTIYYNQKNGAKEIDNNGCNVFRISNKGECFSGFPYKEGTAIPHKTYRYFESINSDSILEIKEFYKSEYLKDTSGQKESKKYVFYISSGFQNPDGKSPNYTYDYAVDYGRNYKNYVP